MNNVFFNHYQNGRGPGREQNLFISQSKHLYLTKAGYLRRQEKAIDARLAGAKRILTRLAVLDVDTGSVYGEYHEQDSEKDLIGFLARAWSKKALHPMRGVPLVLNVPAIALKDQTYREDLTFAIRNTALRIGELPSGFSAGVHALKQLERCVESLMYRSEGREVDLYAMHATAGIVSIEASNSLAICITSGGNRCHLLLNNF
ncbi:hypothetical protein ACFPOU_08425 [Massilia jejuensis]|uniref:Uncharacterized protein n=1 Tax=Massilia jejuensis TaxID=648894 RepID=A0ABW0PHI4_9BURK